MKKLLFFFCVLASSVSIGETFEPRYTEDEMTGERSLRFFLLGEKMKVTDYLTDQPGLCVDIANPMENGNGDVCYRTKDLSVSFIVNEVGFKRVGDVMAYKVGTNDLVRAVMATSDNRKCAFVPKPSEFMRQLKTSNKVLFRFTDTLGNCRTLRFTMPENAVRLACDKWIKENPGKLPKVKK